MFRLILITLVVLLGGCAKAPETIREPPKPDIQLQAVQLDFPAYQNHSVRWGGALLEVENKETESTLEILAYPLDGSGRPDVTLLAQGRFRVKVGGFVDAAHYTRGSEVTVFGRLVEQSERYLSRKVIKLPVLESQQLYLWPQNRNEYYGSGYCGYSPFYGNYRYHGYGGSSFGGYHY